MNQAVAINDDGSRKIVRRKAGSGPRIGASTRINPSDSHGGDAPNLGNPSGSYGQLNQTSMTREGSTKIGKGLASSTNFLP